MLESYIRSRREQKELLLMTHIVLGYPSFDDSLRMVEAMVEAGVDLMELQMLLFLAMVANKIFVVFKANEEACSLRYDEMKGGFYLSAEIQFTLRLFEGTHDVCF